jgi:cytochrome P450
VLDDLLDELWIPFLRPGEGDVVAAFAFPLPALAIAELLGVHADDRDSFKDWSEAVVNALGGGDHQPTSGGAITYPSIR